MFQARVQQMAVLDEKQRLHQQWRNIVKLSKTEAGIGKPIDGLSVVIGYLQARLGFLPIGQEQAMIGKIHQFIGKAHLLTDTVAALLQPCLQVGNQTVPQTLIERTRLGKADRLTRALIELVMKSAGVIAEPLRL